MQEDQKDIEKQDIWMEYPFSKSCSIAERYKRLMDLIHTEDSLAIIINADPDSLASALALRRLFWRRAKKINIFRINVVKRPDNLAFIRSLNIENQHIRKLKIHNYTRFALLDSQPHHHETLRRFQFDIIIDHHPFNNSSKARFLDIREEYGATSTILTEYLRAAKIRPSPRIATALFYGIKTDTDNFMRSSLPNDINAFRFLYSFANINIIKKIESSEITRDSLNIFIKAFEKVSFHKDMAFLYMEEVQSPDHLVILADFLLKIAEVNFTVVSGRYGNRILVIFRNAEFKRNMGRLAERAFGKLGSAGGHINAARAEIELERIKGELQEGMDMGDFIFKKIKEHR